MTTNFIGVLLPNSPDYTVESGFSTELFDADGGQTIIVKAGASLELVGALGANTIRLAGNAADWQVYRDGSNLIAVGANGSHVEVPANTTAQTIAFADVSMALRIVVNGATPAVMLGSQVLDTMAAPVGGVPYSGSTQLAPWTLIMTGVQGIYASDGTADGSHYVINSGTTFGARTIANATQSAAIVLGLSLYGTDGTSAGTAILAADTTISSQTVYSFGNKIVVANGASSYGSGVVTDGTKAGTTILSNLPANAVDPVSQALWGPIQSLPYGNELFRTVVTDTGVQSVLVKDIQPGTLSSLAYGWGAGMAVLSNGKLVFSANDGSGMDPWVSDGTAAGTFKLANMNGSYPVNFVSVGPKVVFTAIVAGIGSEVATTDGTPEGTKVFDIIAQSMGTASPMLGVINDTLYFTGRAAGGGSQSATSIFSTDGVTVREVAKIDPGSSLLGFGGGKVYLKSTDAEHGAELWVVNLADGTTKLVKDILPGSGSALADTYSTSGSLMVGDKFGFTAFTSPTEKGYFLSDGTADGTFEISKSGPRQTVVVGNNIYFVDSDGYHMVTASGKVSLLAGPLAPATPYYASAPLQSDRDQVFFMAGNNNALYTANGGTALQLADSGVTQFKVVGENGVFFIKTMADNTQNLWFSDGTTAGTRFVRALPTGSFDLSNAVGLHTPGVALPFDNTAPVLAFAKVNGKTLTLVYNDDSPLDASHPPAVAAFQLSGTAAAVTGVTVDAGARTVVLNLSQEVMNTDRVLLSYGAGNGVAAIQDSFGNDAASFIDRVVSNLTPDNIPPRLVTAVVDGAKLTLSYVDAGVLDGSHLPSASAFKLEGTAATVTAVAIDASGKKLVLTLSQPVLNTDSVTLNYTDPTSGNDAAAVQDTAGNDAASVTGFVVQNFTAPPHGKAPWTLLVATSTGVYASDGTAAGSKQAYSVIGYKQLTTNADHSVAILSGYHTDQSTQHGSYYAAGIDGSENVALLADGLGNSTAQVLGKYVLLPNYGNTATSGVVTDGTVAGTHLVASLPSGWMDPAHQNIWSSSYSQPYGNELFLTHITDAGVVMNMVKDVAPGSASGLPPGPLPLILPNGKLLFVGMDDTSGAEPWVSDGTEAGTFRLADLQPGSGNTAGLRLLTVFGSLAAMSAIAYDNTGSPSPSLLGRELVVTDGTVTGTHIFDILPGPESSLPVTVGVVDSTFYFTANVSVGSNAGSALFSTDGTTVTRLADINDNVTLLGHVGSKTFFSLSDAAHGAELWVREGSGSLNLVKDILPGTGSGLSGSVHQLVVGDKLVFQAYTSASTQSLFISDGTADGTLALGSAGLAMQAGHSVVYMNDGKLYGVDASAAKPVAVQLLDTFLATIPQQSTSTQLFFATNNRDLYATDGTVNGTVALAHGVTSFKVVGENALYFIEQVDGGTGYGLGYSDGTAAGTYLVSYVDSEVALHLLDNSVAIKTVGVPPAQH